MTWQDLLRMYLPGGAYGLLFLGMGALIVAFTKGWIVAGSVQKKTEANNAALVAIVQTQAETLEELKDQMREVTRQVSGMDTFVRSWPSWRQGGRR